MFCYFQDEKIPSPTVLMTVFFEQLNFTTCFILLDINLWGLWKQSRLQPLTTLIDNFWTACALIWLGCRRKTLQNRFLQITCLYQYSIRIRVFIKQAIPFDHRSRYECRWFLWLPAGSLLYLMCVCVCVIGCWSSCKAWYRRRTGTASRRTARRTSQERRWDSVLGRSSLAILLRSWSVRRVACSGYSNITVNTSLLPPSPSTTSLTA